MVSCLRLERINMLFFMKQLLFALAMAAPFVACKSNKDILTDAKINTILLSYVVESSSTPEDIEDAGCYINPGEYALIIPNILLFKKSDGNLHIIENTIEGVKNYKYEYCGKSGVLGIKEGKYRLVFESDLYTLSNNSSFDRSIIDGSIIEYDVSNWLFFELNEKGIYPHLFLCYAFMDNLARRFPEYITKYDPMALTAYTVDGITVYPFPSIRDKLVDAGFNEWPIYMKGIEEKGTYSFNGYTKTLLPTPAYRTFIYKVHESDSSDETNIMKNKRQFYLQAGIHSAEVMSQIGSCLFVETLVSGNKRSQHLLSNYDFWVVPCLDGYGGMHGDSWTAATINANRNFVTRWWKLNSAQLYNSGLVAGDQFTTQLSMALMDVIVPDVFLDLHTLNDLVTVPSSTNITMEFITSSSFKLYEDALQTADIVAKAIQDKYPEIFKGTIPRTVIGYDYMNGATGRAYMAYKHNDATIALVEVNNTLAKDDNTLNSSMALSVAAYGIRNFIYTLCNYNVTHCRMIARD